MERRPGRRKPPSDNRCHNACMRNLRSAATPWLLFACLGPCAACGASAAASGYSVEWVGELRAVHLDGDARPRVRLSDIEPGAGTFAIGPLAGLRGEITVLDGRAFVARADDEGQHVDHGFEHDAAFLVYGRVAKWRPVPVPDEVRDVAALERWLPGAARQAGLDTGRPFPFKIETATSTVDYHVISRTAPGYQVTGPHSELMRRFEAAAEPLKILGVYSTGHAGIFTHHGQATHLHLVRGDERGSGHVDGLQLGADAVAYLPVP